MGTQQSSFYLTYIRFIMFSLLTIIFVISLSHSAGGQNTPLSLGKIEALIKAKAPDTVIASEIRQRGLTFVPDKGAINKLRQLGAEPLTLEAINDLRAWLDEAKQSLPEIIKRIYKALDQGNPRAASSFISSEIISDSQILDNICKPFTYTACYIESIIERPNRKFEVRARILFQPLKERAQILTFRTKDDIFVLESVSNRLEDWFRPWKEAAMEMAKKFYYALKADRQDVLNEMISSPEVLLPINDYGFQKYLKSVTSIVDQPGIYKPNVKIKPYKGLKAYVELNCKSSNIFHDKLAFYIDKIGTKYKIVEWKFTTGGVWPLKTRTWGCEDPNIESYTHKRFELETKK